MVTDMSGPDVLQFKPKWLAQSPSAPKDARRCRQCAVLARKAALARVKSQAGGKGEVEEGWCPLDLLSRDEEVLRKVAGAILGPSVLERTKSQFVSWIRTTSLLTKLKDVQLLMDPNGVLAAKPGDENANEKLRVAMTVRDCSVFVRLPDSSPVTGSGSAERTRKGEGEGEVEARMGDLDVKSPDKLAYWQETERVLIEEGWYAGTEKGGGGENVCSFGRR